MNETGLHPSTGDLVVDTINDVKISDLVLRTGGPQVITGQKVLGGGLVVRGSVDAPIVNGVDILSLNRTVLKRDQNVLINTSVVSSVDKLICSTPRLVLYVFSILEVILNSSFFPASPAKYSMNMAVVA